MVWKYLFNFCYKCNNIFCVDTYCNSQVSNTATFLASIFFIKQENTLLNTLDYCMFGCTFCSKHEYLNHWLEHVETVVSILKLVSVIPYHVVSLLHSLLLWPKEILTLKDKQTFERAWLKLLYTSMYRYT